MDLNKWARWKFYPGSIIFFPIRMILFMFGSFFFVALVKIFCIGHNFEKGPITGCRKWIVTGLLKSMCRFIMLLVFLRMEKKKVDIDYS